MPTVHVVKSSKFHSAYHTQVAKQAPGENSTFTKEGDSVEIVSAEYQMLVQQAR